MVTLVNSTKCLMKFPKKIQEKQASQLCPWGQYYPNTAVTAKQYFPIPSITRTSWEWTSQGNDSLNTLYEDWHENLQQNTNEPNPARNEKNLWPTALTQGMQGW